MRISQSPSNPGSTSPSNEEFGRKIEDDSIPARSPELGLMGWLRWIWRQLTSMKTALVLLLLLAIAAVPGSVYPQRSADPNGVVAYFDNNPELAPIMDSLQLFDVYTSVWFSAIYILLFISLIGCVIPRTLVHLRNLREQPVLTPKNLKRMPAFESLSLAEAGKSQAELLDQAEALLRKGRYRVARRTDENGESLSAERGYLRETGNLVFHFSLIGVLFAVGIGGGFSFNGQRVVVEGETFVNNLAGYDSFSPGVFFEPEMLKPFSMTLDKFDVTFDIQNSTNIGTPLDFRASVTAKIADENGDTKTTQGQIRVNEPLAMPEANVFLTGNGYAPVVTIRDADGNVIFSGPTEYLPQDSNYTSLGVIKVPDAPGEQFGILSFFYPTAEKLETGAITSIYPDMINPLLTMNVYVGDLGIDDGTPKSVFELDTKSMTQVAGGKSGVKGLVIEPGQTVELPKNLGTVTFDGIKRFASLDVSYNPGGIYVLIFALISLAGVTLSLTIARRRVWVAVRDNQLQLAALARGDDPTLEKILGELRRKLTQEGTSND